MQFGRWTNLWSVTHYMNSCNSDSIFILKITNAQTRWNNLWTKYKQVVDASNISGNGNEMWKFFDHMESMFSTDQRIRPCILNDTAIPPPTVVEEDSAADDSSEGGHREKVNPGRTAPERHEQLMHALAEATKSAERTADSTKLFQERLIGTFAKGFDKLAGNSMVYSEPVASAASTSIATHIEERKVRLAENKDKMDAFSIFRAAKAADDTDTMDFICDMYPDFKRYLPRK